MSLTVFGMVAVAAAAGVAAAYVLTEWEDSGRRTEKDRKQSTTEKR